MRGIRDLLSCESKTSVIAVVTPIAKPKAGSKVECGGNVTIRRVILAISQFAKIGQPIERFRGMAKRGKSPFEIGKPPTVMRAGNHRDQPKLGGDFSSFGR